MRTRRKKTKKRRRRRFYKRKRRMRRKRSRRFQKLRYGSRTRRRRTRRKKKRGGGRKGHSLQYPMKTGMLTKILCGSTVAAAVAACEIVGLGPEDPIADICAWKLGKALGKGCKTFASKEGPVIINMAKKMFRKNSKKFIKSVKKHQGKSSRKKYQQQQRRQRQQGIAGVEI